MGSESTAARDARDRVIGILGLGAPSPLRDLELKLDRQTISEIPGAITGTVASGEAAEVTLEQSQVGVDYQLCFEDGNPVQGDKSHATKGAGGGELVLKTPDVTRDILYSIRATRDDNGLLLPTYLKTDVLVKMGVDVDLPVRFAPNEKQTVDLDGHRITTDFHDTLSVRIGDAVAALEPGNANATSGSQQAKNGTQQGVSYVLVDENNQDAHRCPPRRGNQQEVVQLTTADASRTDEDQVLLVKAFRTAREEEFGFLQKDGKPVRLLVRVRPNPDVVVRVSQPIAPYQADRVIALNAEGYQTSVQYQLFYRPIVWATLFQELDADVKRPIENPLGEGAPPILVKDPLISDWEHHPGFVAGEVFSAQRKVHLDGLTDDLLLVVRATKNESADNTESVQLRKVLVILVRADPSPAVGVVASPIASGEEGFVTVAGTDSGIRFRLAVSTDNEDGEEPDTWGYHVGDRALSTMRVGIDFVVGGEQEELLLLPTGPLEDTGSFIVEAEKIHTSVRVNLKGKAKIEVNDGEEPADS